MKQAFLGRAAAAFTLCAAIAAGAAHANQSSPVLRGQVIVETYCARCHAAGASGDSPLAGAPPFRELGKRYPIASLAEAFAEGIVTGHPGMPQFQFEPRDVDALLAYLASLASSAR